MPATMTTVNNILKELYPGKDIADQLNEEAVGYKRIESTSQGVSTEVGGKYVTFPIRVRRNSGIGYRNELEQLQAAGQQGYASVRIGLTYGYGRIRMSGPSMELAESKPQAFASALTKEVDGLRDDLLKDTNRIFYGDGTGVMATLTSAPAASTTFTVASIQYLNIGDVIDIFTLPATNKATGRTITAINDATNTITVDAVVTAASGDVIVRTGNLGREPQGLASIVAAAGLLYNVDPASEPVWRSIVDTTGGALSEGNMIKNMDNVRTRGGGKPSVIISDLGTRRAYFNLLTQQRRYVQPTKFDGGLTGLAFHYGTEVPLVDDVDAPAGTLHFLGESSFKIYRDQPWHWSTHAGSDIWKWVDNFDAYEALLVQYWQLGIDRRNSHAKMTGITAG
jgi:hypothetical protein